MNVKARFAFLALVVVIVIAYIIMLASTPKVTESVISTQHVVGKAAYSCSVGKSITATYSEGDVPVSVAGQAPTPNGSVLVTLSDGRTLTLPQTISGSGVRYADTLETAVFWNKGNGVMLTENGQELFTNCLKVVDNPGTLPQAYGDSSKGFTLRYPSSYVIDENYSYSGFGPTKTISGVKFTIPLSVATGTNLSSDSYVSVEQIPNVTTCTADLFLDQATGGKARTVTEGDMTYSVSSSTDAAAGNRYEETVYAIPGARTCIAVRYFIHYGAIENYPKGAVKEFDRRALTSQFDAVRRTLTLQ